MFVIIDSITTVPIRVNFLTLILYDPEMVLDTKKDLNKFKREYLGTLFVKRWGFLEYFDYLSSD